MSSELGPNYDWKHEAVHLQREVDDLRKLLITLSDESENLIEERDELVEENHMYREFIINVAPSWLPEGIRAERRRVLSLKDTSL